MLHAQFKRNLSIAILLLIGSGNVFTMNKDQQRRQQEQIDKKMRKDIKEAGPTRRVDIHPNASFSVILVAMNHNNSTSHNQFMQRLRK